MNKEFNLSERGIKFGDSSGEVHFHQEDVKEFIRLLKEKTSSNSDWNRNKINDTVHDIINKLAGEKLC